MSNRLFRHNRLKWTTLYVVLLMAALAWAAPEAERVFAVADGEQYWTAVVIADPDRPNDSPRTSVRLRESGGGEKWREVALFNAAATRIADGGGALLMLTADGAWQWAGENLSQAGRALPDGARLVALASGPTGLWAIGRIGDGATTSHAMPASKAAPATASTSTTSPAGRARLYRMTSGAWQKAADFEAAFGDVTVRWINDAPYVLKREDGRLTLLRLNGAALETVATLDVASIEATLLLAAQKPLVVLKRGDGSFALWRSAAREPALVELPRDQLPAADTLTAAAVVGETVRVVSVESGEVRERAFTIDGKPLDTAPRSLAPQAYITPPPRTWSQTLTVALMVVAVIATLRNRTLITESEYAAARAAVAPLGRRAVAGLIDALPVIVCAVVTVESQLAGGLVAPSGESPLLWAGMGVYVGHTLLSECLFGRTVGKWALGLRVTRLDGTPPRVQDTILRNMMRFIDVIGITLIFVLVSPLRQRIGDAAARTIVVREKKEGNEGMRE